MLTSTADPAAKKTLQLQIKSKDNKLSKVLTREVSMSSNFSIEDHEHGGSVSVSVPFIWESQPGTPKIRFREKPLPPLTPPPSYSFINSPKYSTKKHHPKVSKSNNNNLLGTLFPKRSATKKTPSSSSSAHYSSSYSSSSSAFSSHSFSPWSTTSYSVPSSPIRPSNFGYEMPSNPRLSFDHQSRAVHDHEEESPVSASLNCFGRSRSFYPSIIKLLLKDSR